MTPDLKDSLPDGREGPEPHDYPLSAPEVPKLKTAQRRIKRNQTTALRPRPPPSSRSPPRITTPKIIVILLPIPIL